jgi:hypothetical protein
MDSLIHILTTFMSKMNGLLLGCLRIDNIRISSGALVNLQDVPKGFIGLDIHQLYEVFNLACILIASYLVSGRQDNTGILRAGAEAVERAFRAAGHETSIINKTVVISDVNVDIFNEFRCKKPQIFAEAVQITRNFHTLAKIYRNLRLFMELTRAECELYDNLILALSVVDKRKSLILVQFTDIDLYAVFACAEYLNFVKNINSAIIDAVENGDNMTINLCQIVIAGRKQKLVFICEADEHFDKLEAYSGRCFRARVNRSKNQITVNVVTCNDAELIDNYNKLYNYIYSKNDVGACDSMKQIPLIQNIFSYRIYSCDDILGAVNVDELAKLLRSIYASADICSPVITDDISNGSTIDSKNISLEWIKCHPPMKEKTGDYYARYITDIKNPLRIQKFASLMTENGYKQSRIGTINIWKRSTRTHT